MSHNLHADHPPDWANPQAPRRRRTPGILAGAAAALLLVALVAVIALGASDRTEPTTATATVPTGEVNQMGMPVVSTPGTGTGTASAGGVTVTDARWDLGRVPLNVAVRPTWTLRNTSAAAVVLGQPQAEIRTGCCPGPTTLGTTRLEPGASTTLTFELSMHPGMDGPHDIVLHVPVQASAGTSDLSVAVTGDFRN